MALASRRVRRTPALLSVGRIAAHESGEAHDGTPESEEAWRWTPEEAFPMVRHDAHAGATPRLAAAGL